MKILLINPNLSSGYGKLRPGASISLPINLACLASPLEKAGYEVKIIDANALNLRNDTLGEIISREKPNVIGVTAMTSSLKSALSILNQSKKIDKKIITIIGGTHPTACPQTTAAEKSCDFVVHGEGEITLRELIKSLEAGISFANIKGLAFRQEGKIRETPRREPIADLDNLPMPAYHLLPIEKYRPPMQHIVATGGKYTLPFMTIVGSRGCPYRCIFCTSRTVFGSRIRSRSPKSLASEIFYLHYKYGVRRFNLLDDTFTLKKKDTIELCNILIKGKKDFRLSCTSRVDAVDEELLTKMKKAGFDLIFYGIESGNQEILNRMKKDITLSASRQAIKMTKKVGINTIASYILGGPGETPATLKQTINFAKELNTDFAHFSLCTLYPGTELYDTVMSKKKKEIQKEWGNFIRPEFNPGLAYLPDGFSTEYLKRIQRKIYIQYYLRPTYIIGRLKSIKSIRVFKYYLKGIKSFKGLISNG